MFKNLLFFFVERFRAINHYHLPSIFFRVPNRFGKPMSYRMVEVLPKIRMRLNLADQLQYTVFVNPAFYEPETQRALIAQAKLCPTLLLDVGANVGFMSMAVVHSAPNTHVWAFEPNPNLVSQINDSIQASYLHHFQAFGMGVGEHPGELELLTHPDNAGWSSFNLAPSERDLSIWKKIKVPVCVFDEIARQAQLDTLPVEQIIMKLDVEGHEVHALRGMSELLRNPKLKFITSEIYEDRLRAANSSSQELFDLFIHAGFKAFLDPDLQQAITAPLLQNHPWNVYLKRA